MSFAMLSSLITDEKENNKISYFSLLSILLFPILIVLVVATLLFIEETREFALLLLKENHLVEILTFVFLLIASIVGLRIVLSPYFKKMKTYIRLFIMFISICFFIVAMEEIAWGQQFFKFKTPESIVPLNAQGELTLHNFNQLQGKSEFFRLFYGFFGLIGIYLGSFDFFKKIAPAKILVSFFVVITGISLIDLYADYVTIDENYDAGLQRLSELIEMLIGLSGLLYMLFMKRNILS